jgi:hypothetical protein
MNIARCRIEAIRQAPMPDRAGGVRRYFRQVAKMMQVCELQSSEHGRNRERRQDDREWSVTAKAQIDNSIDHSPLQINDLFIVLFKRILDPPL